MKFGIIFVHLLNDFSGSPKILKLTIESVAVHTDLAKLYLGSSGDGILSSCDIPVTRYWYYRTGHRILTLFTYFFSQVVLFCKLLCDSSIDKGAVIYVNTLLPFGAALYGRLTGRKVIYHVHEISITPVFLKMLLTTIARLTSSLNIYVSDAHMKILSITGVPARRIHNTLDEEFTGKALASTYAHCHDGCFNVLMIASLRDYKGVPELLTLAGNLINQKDIRFDLVVNDETRDIERYFANRPRPSNLTVHPRISDVTDFYGKASLVLNLSRPDQCVETFGLTILEAMAFGIPVIVPPVGGPAELAIDGLHGFWVNSYDLKKLKERVLQLVNDKELCEKMSVACRKRAEEFSHQAFAENIRAALGDT